MATFATHINFVPKAVCAFFQGSKAFSKLHLQCSIRTKKGVSYNMALIHENLKLFSNLLARIKTVVVTYDKCSLGHFPFDQTFL